MGLEALTRWTGPLRDRYEVGAQRRRWARPDRQDVCVVLRYGRIAGAGGLGEPPCVAAERGLPLDRLERQLRFALSFLAARRLEDCQRSGTERPGLALSFDGAHAEVLGLVAPLLRELGVSATLFVDPEFVETGRLCWWEQIGRMLLETRLGEVELDSWCVGSPPLGRIDCRTESGRNDAYQRLVSALWRNPPADFDAQLYGLAERFDVPLRRAGRWTALLGWEDLRQLVRIGFEIGLLAAGGRDPGHPPLAAASDRSPDPLEWIEAEIGRRPRAFADPFAQCSGRAALPAELLAARGLQRAFCVDGALVRPAQPPFALPRVAWSGHGPAAWSAALEAAWRGTPAFPG